MTAADTHKSCSDHPDRHEQLLQAALGGDLPRGDARWRTLRDCADCAARLEQYDRLQGLLDEAGRDQAAVLRAAAQAHDAPGVEDVAPFVRAKLAEQRARKPGRLLSFRAWAAAAAAVALIVGWFERQRSARSDSDQGSPGGGVLLGGQKLSAVHPEGDVSNYLPFEWSLPLPPGGSFTLTVWDSATGDPEQPLSTMKNITEQKAWIAAETVAGWPDRIGWQVQALDATGVAVGSPRLVYAVLKRP